MYINTYVNFYCYLIVTRNYLFVKRIFKFSKKNKKQLLISPKRSSSKFVKHFLRVGEDYQVLSSVNINFQYFPHHPI